MDYTDIIYLQKLILEVNDICLNYQDFMSINKDIYFSKLLKFEPYCQLDILKKGKFGLFLKGKILYEQRTECWVGRGIPKGHVRICYVDNSEAFVEHEWSAPVQFKSASKYIKHKTFW